MSNEAAERLQHWVPEDEQTQANFRWRVNEALAAERKAASLATVERIRAKVHAKMEQERYEWNDRYPDHTKSDEDDILDRDDFDAILDAEAARDA